MVLVSFFVMFFLSCLLSIQFPVYLLSSCIFSVDYPIIDSRCVLFAQPLYTHVFSVLIIESCPYIDFDEELRQKKR